MGIFQNAYGHGANVVTAGQKDYQMRMMQIEKQREDYYRKLGTPPGVPTMKGATAEPENTHEGYNTIIKELGDHSVPDGWIQRPKRNAVPGTPPGPPVQWDKAEDPDDVQPGYGYVPADTTHEDIFFYHTDHLGSTSYITDAKANVAQFDAYLPYGELLVDEHSSTEEMPYKFNGKELDEETGLYYYGARYMNPKTSLWYGVDQLAEKTPGLSAYVICKNNPINLIDHDGNKWYEYQGKNEKKKEWHWIDRKDSYITIDNKKIKGYDFVVQFDGYYNEKLGYYAGSKTKEAGNFSVKGKGAILANVTVYGPKGADDIEHYKGYTVSSDMSVFGVVAAGDYSLDHLGQGERSGPYDSRWTVNNRGRVRALQSFNPRHPDKGYLTGVFVHRPNKDGWAGTFKKNGKLHGVSEGCLLIVPQQWESFNKQLGKSKNGLLRIQRR